MIRYKLVKWEFNKGAWSQAVSTAVDMVGAQFVSDMMEVSPKTVQNWMKMYQSAYGEFPHPSMHNFIKFCNEFDLNPTEFWYLEDI